MPVNTIYREMQILVSFFLLSSLRLGRWPVIPVHLSIFSSVDLGFSSLQGSRHALSLLVDMRMLHSVLLLRTHDVMFWIPHVSRILSFLILSLLVLFIILLSVFISVTSSICIVFAISVRVSAA